MEISPRTPGVGDLGFRFVPVTTSFLGSWPTGKTHAASGHAQWPVPGWFGLAVADGTMGSLQSMQVGMIDILRRRSTMRP
jgi:hypothetical protein